MATTKKKEKKFTFIKGSNPSVVWNPNGKKGILASFKDPKTGRVVGTFTTTDPKVAKQLRKLGYKRKKDYPNGPPKGGFEEHVHPPPDHITPGGPTPSKGVDIAVKEKKTVTTKPSKTETSKKKVTKPKKKKDLVEKADKKKKKKTSKKKTKSD